MIEASALSGKAAEAIWATMAFRLAYGSFLFGQTSTQATIHRE